MSESLLTLLKICFLIVLYLFLARVVRAVWVEIFDDREARAGADPDPASVARRTTRIARSDTSRPLPSATLRIVEPPDLRGTSFNLSHETTVGRGSGCAVRLDDTYASQLHARVFERGGNFFVEDLGSTNGTFVNRKRVHGPVPIRRADRLQVGHTVLEMRAEKDGKPGKPPTTAPKRPRSSARTSR